MASTRIDLDFGHGFWKVFCAQLKWRLIFTHALYKLAEAEWEEALSHGVFPRGFAKINGIPYAFGDSALPYIRNREELRPTGALRYTPEYIGAAMAWIAADVLQASNNNIFVYASHPPRDAKFSQKMSDSIKGDWHVQTKDGDFQLFIKGVRTYDEPLGGFYNLALNADGTEKKSNPVKGKKLYMLDVGWQTTDEAIILPDGSIETVLKSTTLGVGEIMTLFESHLRGDNEFVDKFLGVDYLDQSRLETGLRTGKYPYGKSFLNVERIAKPLRERLGKDVKVVIDRAGGALNFDIAGLSGGGGGLIDGIIRELMPELDFVLADPVKENVKFATVCGGDRFAEMWKSQVVKKTR